MLKYWLATQISGYGFTRCQEKILFVNFHRICRFIAVTTLTAPPNSHNAGKRVKVIGTTSSDKDLVYVVMAVKSTHIGPEFRPPLLIKHVISL